MMESHNIQTPDPLIVDPDVTIAISVLSLFGLATLLCLAILTVVLIRKRRFGVLLATLGGMGVVLMGLGFFYVGFAPLQPVKSAVVDTLHTVRLANQSPIAAPVAPRTLTAEVASDEELASVASAPPKIELDSEIEIGDKAADAKSDRPDWIDAHLGDNQKLIVAGPYAYAQACQIETDQELQTWLAEKFTGGEVTSETMKAVSSLALKNYKKEQHQEVRETSVGEFYILYTLAEVSPKSATEIAEIAKSMATQAAKTARMKGAQFVTFAGAGVLSLVALTHIVLKSGGRKSKNGAP